MARNARERLCEMLSRRNEPLTTERPERETNGRPAVISAGDWLRRPPGVMKAARGAEKRRRKASARES